MDTHEDVTDVEDALRMVAGCALAQAARIADADPVTARCLERIADHLTGTCAACGPG